MLRNLDNDCLRADFGYWGGEKRKKLQSLRNGVSFLVLDHMTAMSYLPQYCVILRESVAKETFNKIETDKNLVDDVGSSSCKIVIKICFRCYINLFKKRRKLLDSLHSENNDLSNRQQEKPRLISCQNEGRLCKFSRKQLSCCKEFDQNKPCQDLFLAQHQEKPVGALQYMQVSLKNFFITVLCSTRILFMLKMSWTRSRLL